MSYAWLLHESCLTQGSLYLVQGDPLTHCLAHCLAFWLHKPLLGGSSVDSCRCKGRCKDHLGLSNYKSLCRLGVTGYISAQNFCHTTKQSETNHAYLISFPSTNTHPWSQHLQSQEGQWLVPPWADAKSSGLGRVQVAALLVAAWDSCAILIHIFPQTV